MDLTTKSIRLGVSSLCYQKLKDDMSTFGVSFSNIVEKIVLTYCESSQRITELAKEKSINDILRFALSKEDIFFKKSILALMVEKEGGVVRKRRQFDGEQNRIYHVWSPTKAVKKALNDDERTQGESLVFISELVEEYTSMPFGKREYIVYRDRIKDIERAIRNQQPFEYVSSGGHPSIMHPYSLKIDDNLQYVYVIGHATALEGYSPEEFIPNYKNVRNIRVHNIVSDKLYGWIKPRKGEKCKINEAAIKRRLESVSIAFSGEEEHLVRVLMNQKGEDLFRSIIHNRPSYEDRSKDLDEDGYREYIFKCTLFQAMVYFWNFEDNAKIIDPPEAIALMRERLKKTATVYGEQV